MKQCTRCKKLKPTTGKSAAFGKNRSKPDGLQSECKVCKRKTDTVSDRKHRARKNITDRRSKHTRRAILKGSYTVEEWQALKEKYNHTCLRCGKAEPAIKLTIDHILPVSKNGSNTIDNIQPLCQSCNSSKGATFIDYRKQYEKDR